MSVIDKSIQYYNYVTGSTGWPTNTNVGVVSGLDYIVETGSNDIYFVEHNTNVFFAGSRIRLREDVYDKISNYVASQSCDTCYVYGMPNHELFGTNPPTAHVPLISESFARHNISVNFEYNENTSVTYFSQRGNTDHLNKFHLWLQSPWYSDDALLDMTSGSFNKNTFRTILSSSPVSSSLIPLFNTASYTDNLNFPDFVSKKADVDAGLFVNGLSFYSYHPNSSSYQNEIDSGSLVEQYIIQSGSYEEGKPYLDVGKITHMLTPNEIVYLGKNDQEVGHKTSMAKWNLDERGDEWRLKPNQGKTAASVILINMYDGSQRQVQDIEVGDVVKSYQPLGMPDETMDYVSYTTTDLSGSYDSGSIVVRTFTDVAYTFYGYYLLNGSIKIPLQSKSSDAYYFVKQSGTWGWRNPYQIAVGDYFLDTDGNELEITSKTEVQEDISWYSLDVEDIDTYFSSNILVHNLPPKCCFVAGTKVLMGDDSVKNIEDVEVGDVVSTYDFDGQLVIEKLVLETKTPVNHNFVKVHFEDGTINENVADHPYYVVGKGWSSKRPEWTKNTHDMDCEKLEVGDICLQVSQDKSIVEQKVVRLETYQEEQKTYNLVVNDTHNYFANNILVHNKICRLCFTYDTMITLSDGTYQKICKVRPGDMIKTYNEDTGKLQNSKVLETAKILHDNIVKYKFDNNTIIEATDNHPFYVVDEGYKAPLQIGDVVLNDEMNKLTLVNIEVDKKQQITYNINSTDNGKNYFANKVLVSDESDT